MPVRYLAHLAMIYLTLPYVLWFGLWFNSWISWIMIILLTVAVLSSVFSKSPLSPRPMKISREHLLIIVMLAFIYTLVSGVGGFTLQRSDYWKHNLLFIELTEQTWPISYDASFLCYYLGYYLWPAFLAKLSSLEVINFFIFLWSWLGLSLFFSLLHLLIPTKAPWGALLFMLWGGMNGLPTIYAYFENGNINQFLFHNEYFYEFARTRLLLPSNISHWVWAPQHALGGWIPFALFIIYYRQRQLGQIIWIFALTSLWSIIATIGFLPFIAFAVFNSRNQWRRLFSVPNLIGIFVGLMTLLFYLAHEPDQYAGFLFHAPLEWSHLLRWLLFVSLEFGLLGIILIRLEKKYSFGGDEGIWLKISLCFLFLLSFFELGKFNDLMMRASIPSTVIVSILSIKALLSQQISWVKEKIILAAVIGIGLFVPLKEHVRWLHTYYPQFTRHDPFATFQQNTFRSILQIDDLYLHYESINLGIQKQYLGNNNSFFARYCLKRTSE